MSARHRQPNLAASSEASPPFSFFATGASSFIRLSLVGGGFDISFRSAKWIPPPPPPPDTVASNEIKGNQRQSKVIKPFSAQIENPSDYGNIKPVSEVKNRKWIDWCKRLQGIAQNGLTFATDAYDMARYTELRTITAEMLADGAGVEMEVVQGVLGAENGYATPKVDVRGVVFRDGKLLLVRERSDGCWTLPGGWADPCASPAENVVREVREESGFETRAEKLLAVFDRSKHPHEPPFAFHVYKMFILCVVVGGSEQTSNETDGVGFFDEANVPELSITRVTRGQVQRMFAHYRNPGLATDFD